MTTKTILITGGNSGLGYEAAKQIALAQPTDTIVIASRNQTKAEQAKQQLISETNNPNIQCLQLDLGSLANIRQFVAAFKSANLPPLYALICNAGLNPTALSYTADGYETTFGVNYLGHFLLTNLLLGSIMDTGKIVFVSSDTHNPPKIFPFPAPTFTDAFELAHPSADSNALLRYPTSKLCDLMLAYTLSKKIEQQLEKHVTVNAFNPGLMTQTNLNGDSGNGFMKAAMNGFSYLLGRHGSAQSSGKALADLITSPQFATTNGRYIDRGRDTKSSPASYDVAAQAKLWQQSLDLTHLNASETSLE